MTSPDEARADAATTADFSPFPAGRSKAAAVVVKISVDSPEVGLAPGVDESYDLYLSSPDGGAAADNNSSSSSSSTVVLVVAEVKAPTVLGARHALETLAQLVAFDELRQALEMPTRAFVRDRPARPLRAVAVDATRRFWHGQRWKLCYPACFPPCKH